MGAETRPIGAEPEYSYRPQDGGLTGFCHTDWTNCVSADCGVSDTNTPYPAMVNLDIEAGTVLPHDARVLALGLLALANEADRRNVWRNITEASS